MTLTPLSSLESASLEKNVFFDSNTNSTCIMSRKWESNVFCSGRNDSNTAQFARIGEKKIFDELDVHHV